MLATADGRQSEFDQQTKALKEAHASSMKNLQQEKDALTTKCQLAATAASEAASRAQQDAVATAQKQAAKTTKQAVDALALANKQASTAAAKAKQEVKTAQDATTAAMAEASTAKQEAAKAAAKALAEKKDLEIHVVSLEKTMSELKKANQAHDDCEARIIALKKQQVN